MPQVGEPGEDRPMPRPDPYWGTMALWIYGGLAQDERGVPGRLEIDAARRELGLKRRSLEWLFLLQLLEIVIHEAQAARADRLEALREERRR